MHQQIIRPEIVDGISKGLFDLKDIFWDYAGILIFA